MWLAVVTGGVNLWGFWWWSPAVIAVAPLMIAGGLVGIASSWLVGNPRSRLFQGVTLGAVIVTALFPQSIEISTRSFYATDSAAFDQVAARALAHGADPYVASMSGVAHLLSVPSRFWTYTVDGGHVAQFSYPAGSFLLSLPATALGIHMAVDWTDLVAWLATIVLLFALVPASLRWLVALLGLTPFFLGSFTSGGTDAMFLPFLVMAVWRWDRYGRAGEPRTGAMDWTDFTGSRVRHQADPMVRGPHVGHRHLPRSESEGVSSNSSVPAVPAHRSRGVRGGESPLSRLASGGMVARHAHTLDRWAGRRRPGARDARHPRSDGRRESEDAQPGSSSGHGRRARCVRRMVPAAQADLAVAPDDPLLLFAA